MNDNAPVLELADVGPAKLECAGGRAAAGQGEIVIVWGDDESHHSY